MLSDIEELLELTNEEKDYLASISYVKKYSKGEIVFYEHETLQYLYFLSSGCLMASQCDDENKKIVLHVHHAKTFVGVAFVILNEPSKITLECLTSVTILKINSIKFQEYFFKKTKILYFFLQFISHRLYNNYSAFVLHEKFLSAIGKTASFIKNEPTLFCTLSLGEISLILNIQQPTLSNILKILKEEKIIAKINGKIEILNFQKLNEHISS